jgi:hypothetical protein
MQVSEKSFSTWKEAEGLPSHVLDGIKPTPVSTIDKVIELPLGYASTL